MGCFDVNRGMLRKRFHLLRWAIRQPRWRWLLDEGRNIPRWNRQESPSIGGTKEKVQTRDSRIGIGWNQRTSVTKPKESIPNPIAQPNVERIVKRRESVGSPLFPFSSSRNDLGACIACVCRQNESVANCIRRCLPKYLLLDVDAGQWWIIQRRARGLDCGRNKGDAVGTRRRHVATRCSTLRSASLLGWFGFMRSGIPI